MLMKALSVTSKIYKSSKGPSTGWKDKLAVVHLYNRMLPRNIFFKRIDFWYILPHQWISKWLCQCWENNSNWCLVLFMWNSRIYKLVYSDWMQISGCLEKEGSGAEDKTEKCQSLMTSCVGIAMLITLTTVIFLHLSIYAKTLNLYLKYV